VVSNLTNRATVLLNYRLGDVVTLGTEPCPCGRTLPTLDRIDGRADDAVLMPDGRLLRGLLVVFAVQHCPGTIQVQLRQEELRRFVVRVVTKENADKAEIATEARRAVHEMVGSDATVEVEFPPFIPPEESGKVRAVVRSVPAPTTAR
jgi:phenylacetate-CoA ligase